MNLVHFILLYTAELLNSQFWLGRKKVRQTTGWYVNMLFLMRYHFYSNSIFLWWVHNWIKNTIVEVSWKDNLSGDLWSLQCQLFVTVSRFSTTGRSSGSSVCDFLVTQQFSGFVFFFFFGLWTSMERNKRQAIEGTAVYTVAAIISGITGTYLTFCVPWRH